MDKDNEMANYTYINDGQMKLHEALSLVNKRDIFWRLHLLTIQRVYTLWPAGGIMSKLSLL